MDKIRKALASRWTKSLCRCACLAASLISWGWEARADEQPFRVVFQAPQGCPDQAEVVRQIRMRTDKARLAEPKELARVFSVTTTADDERWIGVLTIREVDGSQSNRTVPGESCHEVLSAIALIAAVIIDPQASTAPLLSLEPPVTPAPETPEPAPRAAPPPAPVVTGERPAAEASHPAQRFGAGVVGFVMGSVAPDPVAGVGLFVQATHDSPDLLAPLVRLSLLRAKSPTLVTPIGVAQLTWTSARIEGCPIRWPAGGVWGFRPCVLFDAGRLSGSGSRTVGPRTEHALWAAAGLTARFDWVPLSPVFLGAEGGVVFPFGRDRFFFAPNHQVHRIDAVGATASLDVGLNFL